MGFEYEYVEPETKPLRRVKLTTAAGSDRFLQLYRSTWGMRNQVMLGIKFTTANFDGHNSFGVQLTPDEARQLARDLHLFADQVSRPPERLGG